MAPCNEEAVFLVDGWQNWGDNIQLIYGPSASGKTHLLDVWSNATGAKSLASNQIAQVVLEEVRGLSALALDDLQGLKKQDEAKLFHIFNEARAYKIPVLMASDVIPKNLGIELADLVSRLASIPAVAMQAPDDTLLEGLMHKLLSDRQLMIADHVAAFVLERIERSCAAVRDFVEAFDRLSLAKKRPLTRALAMEVLAEQSAKMS